MFSTNSLYIRKSCTIFFYEKVVKWCIIEKDIEYRKVLEQKLLFVCLDIVKAEARKEFINKEVVWCDGR